MKLVLLFLAALLLAIVGGIVSAIADMKNGDY